MTVWIKQGVMGWLHREARRAVGILEGHFARVYISSKGEDASGSREGWSLHFDGRAIDIAFEVDEKGHTVGPTEEQFRMVKLLLGPEFDCVLYDTHIHIEYEGPICKVCGGRRERGCGCPGGV